MVEGTSFTDASGGIWEQGTLSDDDWSKVKAGTLNPTELAGIAVGVAEDSEEAQQAAGGLKRLFDGGRGSGAGAAPRGRRAAPEPPPPESESEAPDEAPPPEGPLPDEGTPRTDETKSEGDSAVLSAEATTRVGALAKSTPLKVREGEGRATKADRGLKQQVLEKAMAEHEANGGDAASVSAGALLEGHGSENPITLDDGSQYTVEIQDGFLGIGSTYTLVKVADAGGASGAGDSEGVDAVDGSAPPSVIVQGTPAAYAAYTGAAWDGTGDATGFSDPIAARTKHIAGTDRLTSDQAATLDWMASYNEAGQDPVAFLNDKTTKHQEFVTAGTTATREGKFDPYTRMQVPGSSAVVDLRNSGAAASAMIAAYATEADVDAAKAKTRFDREVSRYASQRGMGSSSAALQVFNNRVSNARAKNPGSERDFMKSVVSTSSSSSGTGSEMDIPEWTPSGDETQMEDYIAKLERMKANGDERDRKLATRALDSLGAASVDNKGSQRRAYADMRQALRRKDPEENRTDVNMPDSLAEASGLSKVEGGVERGQKWLGYVDEGRGAVDGWMTFFKDLREGQLSKVYELMQAALETQGEYVDYSRERTAEDIPEFVTRREEASEETVAGKYAPENQVINYAAQVASEGQEGGNQAAQTQASTEFTLAQLRELEERRKRQADKS